MKKIAIASLAVLLFSNLKNDAIASQETLSLDVSNQCQAQIDRTIEQLKKSDAYQPYTWVSGEIIKPQYSFSDLRNYYLNVPQNRPYGLSIRLGGSGVDRLWASDTIMKNIASELIGNCSNIAMVTFTNSHSAQDFGLVGNRVVLFLNQVGSKPFCSGKLEWGTSCGP